MYWVFWMVFQNSQTFPGFPGIPGVPELLQVILERSRRIQHGFWVVWTYLGATGGVWTSGGCVWAVPEHLVLGKCWLASPIGARSVKLMAGPGLK